MNSSKYDLAVGFLLSVAKMHHFWPYYGLNNQIPAKKYKFYINSNGRPKATFEKVRGI